jgi:methylglutaconyl-CoA hydratase
MKDGQIKSNFREKGLLEIEFFHPKHNSMPGYLLSDLNERIFEAGKNENVELLIIKSRGDRTFCAGASFEELKAIDDETSGKQFFQGFANVINTIRKCPKLIIGRVHGKAVGGGVGLASAFDYCFATQHSSIKLSELNIGIGPFVIGPAVERKMGISAFSQLTLNANSFYSPQWAKNFGLYSEVYDSTQEMDTAISGFCSYLLTTNPEARAKLKKIFWEKCDDWDEIMSERARLSGKLVLSEFTKDALDKT